ncbi:MAG: phosphate ABC transporter permease subunit PstC [Candidatus Bathyarchaeota archaeon]|nr:phosphate ABC transporter permease subunit PstC [Candidatus Bathyarchaeota archaeon]
MKYILFACAASSILIVFSILGIILSIGYSQLIDWFANGFGMVWFPDYGNAGEYGIIPYIFSTVYVGVGAIAFAAIIGIPCAIYLSEFAGSKFRNLVKPSLEMLTGFPSIIIGYIGFALLVPLLTRYSGQPFVSTLAGWILLGIMALPIITTVSEDAIRRVPNDLREASLGVGATKWQTTIKVLLPSAKPGILASVLLGLGEAIGEVMAISMIMPVVYGPTITLNPFTKTCVLTPLILQITDNEIGTTGNNFWYAIGGVAFILFVMCALLNIAIRFLTKKGTAREQ